MPVPTIPVIKILDKLDVHVVRLNIQRIEPVNGEKIVEKQGVRVNFKIENDLDTTITGYVKYYGIALHVYSRK